MMIFKPQINEPSGLKNKKLGRATAGFLFLKRLIQIST